MEMSFDVMFVCMSLRLTILGLNMDVTGFQNNHLVNKGKENKQFTEVAILFIPGFVCVILGSHGVDLRLETFFGNWIFCHVNPEAALDHPRS